MPFTWIGFLSQLLTEAAWPSVFAPPCHLWTHCGRSGALELASMTTSKPAQWRRGSTCWKMPSLSISLWLPACLLAWYSSWCIYYGENSDWNWTMECCVIKIGEIGGLRNFISDFYPWKTCLCLSARLSLHDVMWSNVGTINLNYNNNITSTWNVCTCSQVLHLLNIFWG